MSDPYGDDVGQDSTVNVGGGDEQAEKKPTSNGHAAWQDDAEELEKVSREAAGSKMTNDFYALLNVPSTASEDAITASYRNLCRVFHPDKHTDPKQKAAAELHFQHIQRAYETLTDYRKRVIYDALGEEGLSTSWELARRTQSPAELREEFEKQAALKRAAAVENLVKSRGELTLGLNATRVFQSYFSESQPGLHLSKRLQSVSFSQLFMKHQWDLPLATDNVVTFQGQMLSRGGAGGGNVVVTYRRTFAPGLQAELSSSILDPRTSGAKLVYSPDQDSFLTASTSVSTLAIPPALALTYGRSVFPTTTGYVSYRTGLYSLGSWGAYGQHALLLSPQRERSMIAVGFSGAPGGKRRVNWSAEGSLGEIIRGVSLVYGFRLVRDISLRFSGQANNVSGLSATIYSERQVTENTKLGLGLNFGYPAGVSLRVRFIRLGQKVTIPILLSREFSAKLICCAAALPALGGLLAERFVIGPRRRLRVAEKLAELREEHAEYIATRRKEADEALSLLREQTERRRGQEERGGGLVIVEATYGEARLLERGATPTALRTGGMIESNESIIDVTLAVQALVHDGQLHIPAGVAKSGLLGFYDPCIGARKMLVVRYRFGPEKRLHTVGVSDTAGLSAPLRSHLA